nr:hypothetical protein [uncultured Flavobacterium sp.]
MEKRSMNGIEFTCWENDEVIEIQLEPEAFIYKVYPGDTIRFIPKYSTSEFRWTLRIDHYSKGVQLFPDPSNSYDIIEIYRNNELIENIAES